MKQQKDKLLLIVLAVSVLPNLIALLAVLQGTVDLGWSCASVGRESDWQFLDDNSGWKDQVLRIHSLNGKLCFQHVRVGDQGTVQTKEICSEKDNASSFELIGDDPNWTQQAIRFKWSGRDKFCARSRLLASNNEWHVSGWKCSGGGNFSEWVTLGDDHGWKKTYLQFSLPR